MRLFICTKVALILVLSFSVSALPAQEKKLTYEEHVKPIFREHCFSCHNQNKKEGDLDLTNYTSLMQGGGSGAVIEPGEVGDSYLFGLVNHDEEPAMPPEQPKIADAKIAILSKWIELGALENSASKSMVKKKKTFDFALTDPAVGKPAVMPLPAQLDLEPVGHAKRQTGVTAMATSPWAPLTAIAGQKQVLLYDTKTRDLKGVLPFPEGTISALKFSRNGSLLLAGGGRGGAQGKVVVWNIKNGERIIEVGDELDSVLAADISSDQKWVALGGPQKMVRIYSTADNSLAFEIKKHTDWVTSIEFSPDGVLLCTGDRNGGVHVWEAFSGREYLTLKAHSKSVTGISWRSDSNIVATTSEDGSVRLWEMNNGGSVRNWTAHGGGSLNVEFTRDGRLVTCGRDRYAKIWDQAGKQLFAFPAFADIVMGVTHCDESNTCFAGDWTGEIRQFNAVDGKQLANVSSNPLSLDNQLAAAQQTEAAALAKAGQLLKVANADKAALDQLTTSIATSKKQVADLTANVAKLTSKMAADQKSMKMMTQSLATVKTRVAALQLAIPELKKAQGGAAAAVAKLSKDAELKKIANDMTKLLAVKETEFKAGSTEANATTEKINALRGTVETDKANLAKYNTGLAAARQSLAKAEPQLKPAQEKYAQSRAAADKDQAIAAATTAARVKWQAALDFSQKFRDLTAQAKAKNSELDELAVKHAELKQQADEAGTRMTSVMNTYTEAKKRVDAKVAEAGALKTKMEALGSKAAAIKTEIGGMQAKLKQTESAMPHLNSAKASLEQASKTAPGDAELVASVQAITALIAGQGKKVTGFQAAIQARTADLNKTSAEMVQNQKLSVAIEKQVGELKILLDTDQKQLATAQKNAEAARTLEVAAAGKVKAKEQEVSALRAEIAKLQGI